MLDSARWQLRDAAEKEHVKWLDKEFWDLLRSNEKVSSASTPSRLRGACEARRAAARQVEDLDGGERVTYKARFVARDKAELAALLAKRVEGTRMGQLLDCYPGDVEGVRVRADVAALQAEGALYALPNAESKEDVLYPRDAAYDVPVDQRLRDMWAFMEVPSDPAALRRELQRCGIQPAVRRAARRPLPPSKEDRKKKRKRDFSKLHVTNVHLWCAPSPLAGVFLHSSSPVVRPYDGHMMPFRSAGMSCSPIRRWRLRTLWTDGAVVATRSRPRGTEKRVGTSSRTTHR